MSLKKIPQILAVLYVIRKALHCMNHDGEKRFLQENYVCRGSKTEIILSDIFQNQYCRDLKLLTTSVIISSRDLRDGRVHLGGTVCRFNRIACKYCKMKLQNDIDNLERWSQISEM